MWVCGYEIVGVMYRLRLRQLSRSTTRKSKSKAPSGSPGGVFLFNSVNTIPAQKLKKFFEKSVTFFIFADYICRIVDNKKSLFSHVLSILLHRRLHRTQFCIIIYPEKAGVWQNILPPVSHIRGLKMTTTSLLLCKRSGRGHTSARCAALRSGR